MNSDHKLPPVLILGLLLNAAALPLSELSSPAALYLLRGAACGLMTLGALLVLAPRLAARLRAWKRAHFDPSTN